MKGVVNGLMDLLGLSDVTTPEQVCRSIWKISQIVANMSTVGEIRDCTLCA